MRIAKLLVAAAALSSAPAMAAVTNLITNGGFEQTTLTTSKQFTVGEITGWSNSQTSGWTNWGYNFLMRPNTADSSGFQSIWGNNDKLYGPNGGVGSANYSNNGFTGTSTLSGGNFLLMDGDTGFHGAVTQIVNNLVVGQTYQLSFDWAGASWFTTPGITTERFDVGFGNQTRSTETVQLGEKGFSGWRNTKMEFVATSTSQTLSFLAQGTPNGLPPSLLLDNVSMGAVPEPATWAMMIAGFGMVGAVARKRRGNVQAAIA